jgi:hypothetical protein
MWAFPAAQLVNKGNPPATLILPRNPSLSNRYLYVIAPTCWPGKRYGLVAIFFVI